MKKKITILECSSTLSIGGTERAMQEFAIGLSKLKNYEVIVGAHDVTGPRRKVIEENGIKVIKLDRKNNAKVVEKYGIDVVHVHGANVDSFKGIKNLKIVKEVVFDNMYDDECDLNLFISKALFSKFNDYYSSSFPKFQEKSQILYYPQNVESWEKFKISKDKVSLLRKKLKIKSNELVLGRLGRAEPSKTDYLLLASASKIAKKYPNVKFVFLGLPLLFRTILKLNPSLRKRMIFLPQTSSDKTIAEFYQLIDVFWHTASNGETFGSVNTEAMIFKNPVITHYVPITDANYTFTDNAQCEIITHNKTGLVASYPDDIVKAVGFFYKDKKNVEKFGTEGYKKVNEKFASKVIIEEFDKILQNLLGKSKFNKVDFKEISRFVVDLRKNQIMSSKKSDINSYLFKKRIYKGSEWSYLVIRKLMRDYLKVNIEDFNFFIYKK